MIRRLRPAGCVALSLALLGPGLSRAWAAGAEAPPAVSSTPAATPGAPSEPAAAAAPSATPAQATRAETSPASAAKTPEAASAPAKAPATADKPTAAAAQPAPAPQEAPPAASETAAKPEPATAAASTPAASAGTASPASETASTPAAAPSKTEPAAAATPATTPAAPAAAASAPPAPAVTQSAPAPTPVPAPAPTPTLAQRMAPAIRQAIEALQKSELPRGLATVTRRERAGLSDFYASRADAPLWLDAEGHWTQAARGALARLQHADEDALDLKIPALPVLDDKGDDAARAATDVALSMAVVVYGKEASDGRVDPHAISPLIDDKPENFTPAQILTRVSEASDADAALRGFNPPQAGYVALREKLAELRHGKMEEVTPIPPGRLLRIGMRDDRVPLLRERFGLPARSGAAARLYDRQVSEAVRAFQKEHRLAATGHLNGRTVEVLSGGRKGRLEDDIIANMELWRWMPRDYGADRVEVNIPDFALKVVENGEVVHRAKVIVGKKNTPTPIFSNAIRFIIVNPYWNVPQSIIRKEMLPKLAQDPNYFRDMGYEAFYRHGRLVVRQPPGERNALGRIKFMFPNDHAVYLHDTPSKGLFSARVRAFSHGCVRVQEPLALAETVLGKEKGWSESHFKRLIGGPQRTLRLPKALPIHIEYFTAYVDEKGHLQLRADVYGYSQKLKEALGLAG